MSVLVTMQVGPVDWDKFRSASEWLETQGAPGLHSRRVYRSESDPSTVFVTAEWESHDRFHDFSDRVGDEFNKRAGTEGANWETGAWTLSDAPAWAP